MTFARTSFLDSCDNFGEHVPSCLVQDCVDPVRGTVVYSKIAGPILTVEQIICLDAALAQTLVDSTFILQRSIAHTVRPAGVKYSCYLLEVDGGGPGNSLHDLFSFLPLFPSSISRSLCPFHSSSHLTRFEVFDHVSIVFDDAALVT